MEVPDEAIGIFRANLTTIREQKKLIDQNIQKLKEFYLEKSKIPTFSGFFMMQDMLKMIEYFELKSQFDESIDKLWKDVDKHFLPSTSASKPKLITLAELEKQQQEENA